MSKILISTLIFLILSPQLFANIWVCKVTLIDEKKGDGRRIDITADLTKESIGSSNKVDEYEIFLWRSSSEIKSVIKKNSQPLLKSSIDDKVSQFTLDLPPTLTSICKIKPLWDKQATVNGDAIWSDRLDLSQITPALTSKIVVTINQKLTFPYRDPEATNQMRSLYFQDGKCMALSALNKNSAWCNMTIQIKLDENTYLNPPLHLYPATVETLSNNETQGVFSINFVDFDQGHSKFVSNRFTPFTLQCSYPKGSPFTPQLFHKITGNQIILSTMK